ncbi:MAG TPA: DUF3619 family protein [Rudaea sp.]|nr:DUF3619 family protein [Rudaea sp.]
MSDFRQTPWVDRAKQLLDESAAGLDAATVSRLNRARQAALGSRRRGPLLRFMPAALASACALLLAVGTWHRYHVEPGDEAIQALSAAVGKGANGTDIDLVAGDDSLDLYQDLEFYAWLDAQEQGSDS